MKIEKALISDHGIYMHVAGDTNTLCMVWRSFHEDYADWGTSPSLHTLGHLVKTGAIIVASKSRNMQ